MGGVAGETNGGLVENNNTGKEVIFGDLIWIKLREASWWPAQVVDENCVSSANKPSKRSSNDVLVRLYGSYIYKYADVNRSRADFRNVLIQNNFNYDDILKKSLEQDLPSLRSSKSRRQQQSKSKETVVTKSSKNGSSKKDVSNKSQTKVSSQKRKQEQAKTLAETPETKNKRAKIDGIHHDTEPSTPKTCLQKTVRSEELSGRRMKVMQSLGLVAPSGSPFPRNRVTSPAPTVLN